MHIEMISQGIEFIIHAYKWKKKQGLDSSVESTS